jgi:hypothetical protein
MSDIKKLCFGTTTRSETQETADEDVRAPKSKHRCSSQLLVEN